MYVPLYISTLKNDNDISTKIGLNTKITDYKQAFAFTESQILISTIYIKKIFYFQVQYER